MPVEIAIISGARKGERIQLDSGSFQVGDESACEVYFNPRKDPAVGGRRALITLEESGWRIQNIGSGLLLVNQDVVEGPTPLRSGDIIRMSDMGPDLTFTLISAPKGAAARADDTLKTSRQTPAATADETGAAEEQPAAVAETERSWSSVGLGVLIGVVVFLVAAVLALFLMPSKPESQEEAEPATEAFELQEIPNQSVREAEQLVNQAPTIAPISDQVLDVQQSDTLRLTVQADDPWNAVTERVAPAVCLLVAEEPKTRTAFPYGTACAIRSEALLTSAALAVELDKRRRSGWQVWAEWPERGERLPVREILVHRGFIGAADTPAEQVYWDLAVLLVDGELQNSATLAGPQDLSELEPGCELGCLAIAHEGEPLTRFDNPTVELTQGKLFQRTALATSKDADGAGAPVLLHLKATLPDNIYGSPIVNQAGSIVGIYAEKAQLPEADERLQIHYAPVVTLAHAWLTGQGIEHWITPK